MGLFWAIAVIGSISTLAGFLGHLWWLLELAVHFRAQYFLLFSAGTAVLLVGGRYKEALLCGAFALFNLALVLPFYWPPHGKDAPPPGGEPTLRILHLNVERTNQDYSRALDLIRKSGADWVVLEEVNARWMREIELLRDQYPFMESRPGEDGGGIALLSRIPFQHAEIRSIGVPFPSVVAKFRHSGQVLTLIGTHLLSPTNRIDAGYRNRQMEELSRFVASQEGQVILAGDFNITPWSPFFRDLLRNSGLTDTRRGYGIRPTWPTWLPLFWIPIDHCLVSSGVTVQDYRIAPSVGSDHYPLIMDFSLKPL